MSEEEIEKVEVNVDSVEALADNIKFIADQLYILREKFNDRAIIALIYEFSPRGSITKTQIKGVLETITHLDQDVFND